jgi:hypothetical protein
MMENNYDKMIIKKINDLIRKRDGNAKLIPSFREPTSTTHLGNLPTTGLIKKRKKRKI